MFAVCGQAWGFFNGGNGSDSFSIFDAVTAVDSGMRALEFLGLDEHQRSSVVDVSFQVFRITLVFSVDFEKLIVRLYCWEFDDDCLGFEGGFDHHWLLYAWDDWLWAPQTNQGSFSLSVSVSVSVQKSDLDVRNCAKEFWNEVAIVEAGVIDLQGNSSCNYVLRKRYGANRSVILSVWMILWKFRGY